MEFWKNEDFVTLGGNSGVYKDESVVGNTVQNRREFYSYSRNLFGGRIVFVNLRNSYNTPKRCLRECILAPVAVVEKNNSSGYSIIVRGMNYEQSIFSNYVFSALGRLLDGHIIRPVSITPIIRGDHFSISVFAGHILVTTSCNDRYIGEHIRSLVLERIRGHDKLFVDVLKGGLYSINGISDEMQGLFLLTVQENMLIQREAPNKDEILSYVSSKFGFTVIPSWAIGMECIPVLFRDLKKWSYRNESLARTLGYSSSFYLCDDSVLRLKFDSPLNGLLEFFSNVLAVVSRDGWFAALCDRFTFDWFQPYAKAFVFFLYSKFSDQRTLKSVDVLTLWNDFEEEIGQENIRGLDALSDRYFGEYPILLVMPVGPPGVGKTTILKEVIERLSRLVQCAYFSRDEAFKIENEKTGVRSQNVSDNRKNVNMVTDEVFRKFPSKMDVNFDVGKPSVLFYDAVNASAVGRYGRLMSATGVFHIIFVNFLVDGSNEDIVSALCDRTSKRKHHPNFPEDERETRKVIGDIHGVVEYATLEDGSSLPMGCTCLNYMTFSETPEIICPEIYDAVMDAMKPYDLLEGSDACDGNRIIGTSDLLRLIEEDSFLNSDTFKRLNFSIPKWLNVNVGSRLFVDPLDKDTWISTIKGVFEFDISLDEKDLRGNVMSFSRIAREYDCTLLDKAMEQIDSCTPVSLKLESVVSTKRNIQFTCTIMELALPARISLGSPSPMCPTFKKTIVDELILLGTLSL